MARVSSVRLTKSPDLSDAIVPKRDVKAINPEQQLYGIFGPQYAALLAQQKKSSAEGAFDKAELRRSARNEQVRYDAALREAQAAQERMANIQGYYDLATEDSKHLDEDVDRGMGGVRGAPTYDDKYGVWRSTPDQTRVDVANANVLNTDQADRFGKYATATKDLRDAGVDIPAGYLGQLLAPPTQKTPVPVATGTTPLTPSQETARYSADEGLTAEQQMQQAAERAAAKEHGVELDYEAGEGGVVKRVYKGTPDAIQAYKQSLLEQGIDMDTGKPINVRPNAGTNGGVVPATPAAKTIDPKPVSDARSIMLQLHGIEPSDWKRDPNSKLGKANPSSWHNRTGAAIDARPRELRAKYGKDYTYDQYVQSYKNHGYSVIEARDEEKHPLGHTTGPNWHVVLGQARDPTAIYASRLKQHPEVQTVTPAGDGTLLVTLKDGTQRVYKGGKRVG